MYEIVIELGKVREFARATMSTNPIHLAGNAIPPTFLATAATLWEPPSEFGMADVGFDLARVLHGEEEYTFFGPPPRVGQALQVTTQIGERFEREGKRGGTMKFATVIHEFRDETGELIAEQRSTIIETAVAPENG